MLELRDGRPSAGSDDACVSTKYTHTEEQAMTFHIAARTTTTATTTARTFERKSARMAIGSAALALTVAAGFGVWQVQQHTDVQTAIPGAIAPVQRSVAGESALPLGGVA